MRTLAAGLFLTLAIAACGKDVMAPDLSASSGNYVLQSINRVALPFTIATQTTYKLEITADTIYMTSAGAFTDVTHYRRTQSGIIDFPADTLGGSWTQRGTVVTYTATTGDVFAGNLSGTTMVIEGGGISALYIR